MTDRRVSLSVGGRDKPNAALRYIPQARVTPDMPENDRRVTGTLSTVRETGGGYIVEAEITYNGDPDNDPDLSDTVYIMRGGDVLASENGVELDPGKTATVELEVTDHDGEVVVLYYGDEPGALDSTTLVAPESEPTIATEIEDLRTQVATNSDGLAELEARVSALEDKAKDADEPDEDPAPKPSWVGSAASVARRVVREFTR